MKCLHEAERKIREYKKEMDFVEGIGKKQEKEGRIC